MGKKETNWIGLLYLSRGEKGRKFTQSNSVVSFRGDWYVFPGMAKTDQLPFFLNFSGGRKRTKDCGTLGTVDYRPTSITSTFKTVFFCVRMRRVCSVCSRVIGHLFPSPNRCPVLFYTCTNAWWWLVLMSTHYHLVISVLILLPILTLRPFNLVDSLTDPDKVDTAQQSEWVLITL
jgi:hypothetical protein